MEVLKLTNTPSRARASHRRFYALVLAVILWMGLAQVADATSRYVYWDYYGAYFCDYHGGPTKRVHRSYEEYQVLNPNGMIWETVWVHQIHPSGGGNHLHYNGQICA